MRIKFKELIQAVKHFEMKQIDPYSIDVTIGRDYIKMSAGKHSVYLYNDHDSLQKKPEKTLREKL